MSQSPIVGDELALIGSNWARSDSRRLTEGCVWAYICSGVYLGGGT